ncbi:hypothetical protein C8Q74DRAFT_1373182 [Fomes fomentarius]|nr:hypothetical protein C8Q74DRAFT_1373182 [Fomes fomentarius]
MPFAGFLIYSGVMPLIKTYITMVADYEVARMDLFPNAAARGASYVTMNMALPTLIFGNVIPAFTPSNIQHLAPCVVILTGMSNWGNLPTAVVLSVTAQAPFNSDTDPACKFTVGVSYVSIFIVAYYIVFFMLGAAHSISWDYLPRIPLGEVAERPVCWKERQLLRAPDPPPRRKVLLRPPLTQASRRRNVVRKGQREGYSQERSHRYTKLRTGPRETVVQPNIDPDVHLVRKTSRLSTDPVQEQPRRASISYAPAESSPVPPVPPPTPSQSVRNFNARSMTLRSATLNTPALPQKIVRLFRPLSAVVTPVTIALVTSLPISLVNPLKALFVDISDISSYMFKGPDGRPPLAFLIDTGASSTGDHRSQCCSIHSLIILGFTSEFHRRSRTHPSWCELRATSDPAPALALAYHGHVAIDAREDGPPVIGVFLVQTMTASGFVDRDAKVLRFVMVSLSCTPTAVNQLIVAALYSDGYTDTLAPSSWCNVSLNEISSSSLP